MSRPTTPEAFSKACKHADAPTNAAIQGTVAYLKARGLPCNKRDIFQFHGVAQNTGYRILRSGTARKRHNSGLDETRGRPYKLTEAQIHEADAILQEEELGMERKRYTWTQLATEIGAEIHGDTMKRCL